MNRRMVLALAAALTVAGCGVKNDLEKPNSDQADADKKKKATRKDEKDPSKPPSQLGK